MIFQIWLFFINLSLVLSNVISLENFKIAEKVIQTKNRFVFTDSSDEILKNATVKFDMSFSPKNYDLKDKSNNLKLYVMVVKSEAASLIYDAVEAHIKRNHKVKLDYILKPFIGMITYFKPIQMSYQKPTKLNESVKIKDEGVYYTLFLYENSGSSNSSQSINSNRIIWSISPHLVLNGDITYHNSNGYLNGEQQPYLGYFPIITMLYFFLTVYWIYEMNRYRDHLINLHYYILAIICISLLQCIFNMSQFDYYNSNGVYNPWLMGISVLLEVLRNTFARVITLLVALGYGILITTMGKYQTKVMLLAFFYMIAHLAYLGLLYVNQSSPVSGSMIFIVSFPLSVINSIFYFWIFMALRRSIQYLTSKEQTFKLQIISQIFNVICVCIIISVILMFMWFVIQMFTDSRDSHWKQQWLWETSWFWIFSGFLISIVRILKPDENSDMLTQMEELLDETLNEVPTGESFDADEMGHGDFEGQVELHEFGVTNSTPSQESSSEGPSIYEHDEKQPEMTMEEFKQMKRKQRMDKINSSKTVQSDDTIENTEENSQLEQ